jgi:hypothetical protein
MDEEEKEPESAMQNLEETVPTLDTSKMDATIQYDRFKIDLDNLMENFFFPRQYQHPLAAARMIIFGENGPLDEKGLLRTGFKGNRVVLDYELEAMCDQVEKDDVTSIYLHRQRDLGMLSSAQQLSIITQADAHLKRAKGRALLPRLTKEELYSIFDDVPRDGNGLMSFHEMQKTIAAWRDFRIRDYKRVFPSLGGVVEEGFAPRRTGTCRKKQGKYVTTEVAPRTMFLRNEGRNNADQIKHTSKMMARYNFQINEIDYQGDTTHLTTNCKLLRDADPKIKTPRWKDGPKPKWSRSTDISLSR